MLGEVQEGRGHVTTCRRPRQSPSERGREGGEEAFREARLPPPPSEHWGASPRTHSTRSQSHVQHMNDNRDKQGSKRHRSLIKGQGNSKGSVNMAENTKQHRNGTDGTSKHLLQNITSAAQQSIYIK